MLDNIEQRIEQIEARLAELRAAKVAAQGRAAELVEDSGRLAPLSKYDDKYRKRLESNGREIADLRANVTQREAEIAQAEADLAEARASWVAERTGERNRTALEMYRAWLKADDLRREAAAAQADYEAFRSEVRELERGLNGAGDPELFGTDDTKRAEILKRVAALEAESLP